MMPRSARPFSRHGQGGGPARAVDGAYTWLAPVYDVLFGTSLEQGRRAAMQQLPIRPGSRILEVGIGTGLGASRYPAGCDVTGVDVSPSMLARAARRLARQQVRHVRLLQMDAGALGFPDESFSVAYAAYVLNAVAEPGRVIREMVRVCRPGGYVVLLNHFRNARAPVAWVEDRLTPITKALGGFSANLELAAAFRDTRLDRGPLRIDRIGPFWSLVTYRKPGGLPASADVTPY